MDILGTGDDSGKGLLKLLVGFVGSISGVKIVSALINKYAERTINRDLYRHQDADKFAEREAKRADALEIERKRLLDVIDREVKQNYELKFELRIITDRLASQMDQNTELCEDLETWRQRSIAHEKTISELRKRLRDSGQEA